MCSAPARAKRNSRRLLTRTVTLAAAGLAGAVALAVPAWAHVEVTADNPQAGAINVTVSFAVEAESSSAGVTGIEVQLPAGIPPADVTLAAGPAGWTLATTAGGYAVSGPELAVGENADYQVRIAALPADATSLAFKTLQNYSDGSQESWIEVATDPAVEPEHPAPVLQLSPATTTAAVPTTTSAAATTPPAAPTSAAPTETAAAENDSGGSGALWWVLGGAAIVVAVVAAIVVRRRGGTE